MLLCIMHGFSQKEEKNKEKKGKLDFQLEKVIKKTSMAFL